MAVKIWSNTSTLDGFLGGVELNSPPELAEVGVIGASAPKVEDMPRLRFLFRCGVGTDNIDFDACSRRGITVVLPSSKTRDIIYDETANFAVAAVLHGLYRWQGSIANWEKSTRKSLSRRNVLLLGQGNIGSRVKDKLRGFVDLETWDPAFDPEDALLPRLQKAEVVSLHMPLDVSTTAWFDSEFMSYLPDGACIVNTSRGGVVNEQSLLEEISSGRLTGIFDTFWEEPYFGPLRQFHPERFVMTPHIASGCDEFVQSLAEDFRNLLREHFPDSSSEGRFSDPPRQG